MGLTVFYYTMLGVSFASLLLCLGVLFLGHKTKAQWLWTLMCFSVAVWSLGQAHQPYVESFETALRWTKLLHIGAFFLTAFFFHFVTVVTRGTEGRTVYGAYVASAVFSYFTWTGELFGMRPLPPMRYYTHGTWLYSIFAAYFFIYISMAHAKLYRAMMESTGTYRNQMRYIFWGTSIAFAGGSMTFLPVMGIGIIPYGAFAVILYVPMVSYAIYKHKLMDMTVLIRKTALYSLTTAALTVISVLFTLTIADFFKGLIGSILSSVLVAATVTLLFHPLRMKVQRMIDNLFPTEALDPNLLREITGGFVHEIKRPLSHIALPAEMALNALHDIQIGKGDTAELHKRIESHLKHILRQSLDAGARMEALHELTLPDQKIPVAVHLVELLKRCLETDQTALEGITTRIQGQATVRAVPRQLEIVISNLIRNAAHSMKTAPARELRFDITKEGTTARLRVTDTGLGIPPEQQSRLFQPYFTTKKTEGTGLGLFLSRRLMEAQGGSITLDVEYAPGTSFVLELPAL
jgi:signal transduction histidine kinase